MDLDVMTKKQFAEALGFTERTVDNWHYKGKGPKRFIVGGSVFYRKSDVTQWIDEQGEK